MARHAKKFFSLRLQFYLFASSNSLHRLRILLAMASKESKLLEGIKRKPVKRHTAATAPAITVRKGQPVQFWLHEEDRQLINELRAWFASQGKRTTDSMIIRAALRVAKDNEELLAAYDEAAQLDGRLKAHRQAS